MSNSQSLHVRRRAFSVVQLIILAVIVIVLIAFLLPFLNRMRQSGGRITCTTQLREIGQAIQMYTDAERHGGFPRTNFDESDPRPRLDLTDAGFVDQGKTPVDSFSDTNSPARANLPPNSVGGSFFLLLKTQDLTPDVFTCPSSNATRGFQTFSVKNSNNFGGWGPSSEANAKSEPIPDVSYSFLNPFFSRKTWDGGRAGIEKAEEFAIVADVNPGTQNIKGMIGSPATVFPFDPPEANANGSGQAFGNSTNHKNQGQNVLYLDGHVEFQTTCWCGSYRTDGTSTVRDNIYTNGTQSTAGGSFDATAFPKDKFDSVLLPTSN